MPNDIKKLRRLMKAANTLRKNNPVVLRGASATQSQALKYAWWFENFRAKLATGIYRFSYLKKDGTIREAIGTLNFDYIPSDQLPKGDEAVSIQYSAFRYFDLERNDWRAFSLDHFIGFVEEVKKESSKEKIS